MSEEAKHTPRHRPGDGMSDTVTVRRETARKILERTTPVRAGDLEAIDALGELEEAYNATPAPPAADDKRLDRLMVILAASEQFKYSKSDYLRRQAKLFSDLLDAALPASPAPAARQETAIAIIEKHRRHVEQSPGVGAAVQDYALSLCDEILADLRAAADKAGE